MTRFPTSSALTADARHKICAALNTTLTDGIDLYTQIKIAHWNIKGPHFAALHPLLDQFASDAAGNNDDIAERIVTMGELAHGTARHVARLSRLEDYPQNLTRDLEHAALLVERFDVYLDGLRVARGIADEFQDIDTSDLLTGVVRQFEKHAWFLRATLEP